MLVVTLPLSAVRTPAAFARRAKHAGAEILEIRGDLTPDVKKFSSPLPLIVSPRGKGTKLIERFNPAYVDFDLVELPPPPTPGPSPWLLPLGHELEAEWRERRGEGRIHPKIILSHHDYKQTPKFSELKNIARQMIALKPFAIKIVTLIQTYDDLVTLEKLRSEITFPRVSIFGMGEKAHLSRMLSLYRDEFTYAYLDGSESAAVGQLPLSLYRVLPRMKQPKIFGIIGGSQISKSLSPIMHSILQKRHGIDAVFSAFPTDNFRGTVKALQAFNVSGYCATSPFKREAFAMAKLHDPLVKKIQSANTLVKKGTDWSAANTDVTGIEHGYPLLCKAKTVAILGAGGAVPSVIDGIRRLNPDADITVFVRDTKKGEQALGFFDVSIRPLREAKGILIDAVICAISEDIAVQLPKPLRGAVAVDLRYGKRTKFINQAKKNGYRVYDGLPMLIHQGLRQFEIFTGVKTTEADARALAKILSTSH